MEKTAQHANGYALWTIRHRWLIIVVCFLLVSLAASGVRYLEFTTDFRVFFGPQNPELLEYNALEDKYTNTDNILFVLKPDEGDIFNPRILEIILRLTEDSWQIPHAIRVDSITNLQNMTADGDDIVVADLVETTEGLNEGQIDYIRHVALNEPSLVKRLVASDGRAAGIQVTLQFPGEDHTKHVPQSVYRADEMVKKLRETYPDITAGYTGIAVMSQTNIDISKAELGTLGAGMYVIIVIFMIFLLRSFSGTIAVLMVVSMSVAIAVGLSAWMGWRINTSSAIAPVIILTLAIADSIHILITMFDGIKKGMSRNYAIVESMQINMKPVFLTSLTTTIGFLSLNFSDSPPFHDLGNISAIGVITAWILTMTFLPAVMSMLPLRIKRSGRSIPHPFERFGGFLVRKRTILFWTVTSLALIIAAFIPGIKFDDRWMHWFDIDVPLRIDTDFATKNLAGPYSLEFSVESGEAGGISGPAYLKRLDVFSEWLMQQPEVVHVNSFADVMKRLNRSMHGDDENWYSLPEQRDLAAQYLLLYEMSLPFGLDMNSTITVDKSATRLTAILDDISSSRIRKVAVRAEEWLKYNMPEEMHSRATGVTVVIANLFKRNISGMLKGTALAFLLIAVTLGVSLKSLRLGLISLVANFVPIVMTFGLWAAFVGEIGLIASILTATSMGLIVDDTVHILTKYNRARNELNMSVHDAIRYIFSTVGMALWTTTVILVAGFGVLGFSDFKMNSDLGILTTVTLLNAIIMDFLLVPSILMFIDKEKVCNCDACR